MIWATELLASCAVDVPECDDTLASIVELPLVLAVLAVLLIVGIASALGVRDRSGSWDRARRRGKRARSPEFRAAEPGPASSDAVGDAQIRS